MHRKEEINILIAEDDVNANKIIRKLIESLECNLVGQAWTGKEAIELTRSIKPDVILMDLSMPDIDGIEATRRIFQTDPTPVVILTAYDTPDMVEKASEAGAGAYLVKMPKTDELERAITVAMTRFDDLMKLRNLNRELKEEIARRVLAEKRREEAQNFLNRSMECSPVGILLLDKRSRFSYLNQTVTSWLGRDRQEFIDKSLAEVDPLVMPRETTQVIAEKIKTAVQTGVAIAGKEIEIIKQDDGLMPVVFSVAGVKSESGDILGGIIQIVDITERVRVEEALKHMATHDALTGLPNRRLFNDRIELEMAHARRNQQKIGLMYFDLDYFKKVNDTFGHRIGDHLLQLVGKRLAALLRESDTVARMGGDEFTLISPEMASKEDAIPIAERVMSALREPFEFDGQRVRVSTSLGIAIYPDDGEDVDTLMKHADIAMYRAKEQGRDRYRYYDPDD